jgi:hypothetical protein
VKFFLDFEECNLVTAASRDSIYSRHISHLYTSNEFRTSYSTPDICVIRDGACRNKV